LWAVVAFFGDFFEFVNSFVCGFLTTGQFSQSFFFENIFHKMAKIDHQKNHYPILSKSQVF